jgi:hypothetical protein
MTGACATATAIDTAVLASFVCSLPLRSFASNNSRTQGGKRSDTKSKSNAIFLVRSRSGGFSKSLTRLHVGPWRRFHASRFLMCDVKDDVRVVKGLEFSLRGFLGWAFFSFRHFARHRHLFLWKRIMKHQNVND